MARSQTKKQQDLSAESATEMLPSVSEELCFVKPFWQPAVFPKPPLTAAVKANAAGTSLCTHWKTRKELKDPARGGEPGPRSRVSACLKKTSQHAQRSQGPHLRLRSVDQGFQRAPSCGARAHGATSAELGAVSGVPSAPDPGKVR